MKSTISCLSRCWAAIAVLAVAAGCSTSKPARFYLLDARSGATDVVALTNVAHRAFVVQPVEIPSYVNRPQMVTLLPAGRLELAEYDRWAEPLQESIRRALIARLQGRLPGCTFETDSWSGGNREELRVRIVRFDCDSAGTCFLQAEWAERPSGLGSSFTATLAGPDAGMEARLATLGRLVTQLADRMADSLAGQARGR